MDAASYPGAPGMRRWKDGSKRGQWTLQNFVSTFATSTAPGETSPVSTVVPAQHPWHLRSSAKA